VEMTSYCVEYSKSNRAGCKVCKGKIDKDALRIGSTVPGDGDYDMTSWRHLECQKKPKAMDSLDMLQGLDTLSEADQAKVKVWFEAASAPKSATKKRKADEVDGGEGGSEELPSLTSASIKKMKAGELKAALGAHGLSTSGKKADHVARLQEVADRQAADGKFGALKIDQLKDALRENGQLLGGVKEELVDRCVDGFLFGALPRCPECGGAVLKVKYPVNESGSGPALYGHGGQGQFFCPGFYDDDHWHRCKFGSSDVERTPWKDTTTSASASNAPPPAKSVAKSKKQATAKVSKKPEVAMPSDDD